MKLQDQALLRQAAFVDGGWIQASDAATFAVLNPATSEPIASVPDLGSEESELAVQSSAKAATVLKSQTGKQRGELLKRWYDAMIGARDDLARIITAENGKPKAEALGEIDYAAGFLDWFAGAARRIEGTLIRPGHASCRVVAMKQPVGVVSIITPWNFPAAMVTRKVAAAIAAGCPCIIKPAAETPLTALALAELADRAGFPPGAINVLTTSQYTTTVGKILTQHPEIRKFSFTGSTAVGKMLAAQCMSTVKRVSLELGGNAPFIVFDDADINEAVEGLMASKFRLTGQTCVCANRVFVQDRIFDRLAAAVVEKVKLFRLGDGEDPKTTLGPLISPGAVAKVQSHVKDAVERGAVILQGGEAEETLGKAFFQPTVLAEVSLHSLCAQEETFGPLLPMIRFQSEAEVIKLANATSVGLAGYFYTETMARAWRVAEELEVGMVGINTGIISDPASPFGGIKESGFGREGSSCGIEEYLEVKSVTFNIGSKAAL